MLKKGVILLSAVALAATIAVSQQQPGAQSGQRMGLRRDVVRPRAQMAEKLNLTDQQKLDMQKLRIEMQRKNIPLQSQIRLARLEIQQLMLADKPDRAKLEKWMREVSDLQLQIKLNGLDHMFAMKNLLTPEQQKLWKEQRGGQGMQQRRIRIMRGSGALGQVLEGEQESLDLGTPIDIGVPDEAEVEEEVGEN
jgi:Spy/CpxP family protein refolding chaperone